MTLSRKNNILVRCVAACAVGMALPGAAHGQTCSAPPGTSAVDEYCETVPGSTGDQGSGAPSTPRELPPRSQQDLRRAGKDGAAVLRLTGAAPKSGATSPHPKKASSNPASRPDTASRVAQRDEPSDNPLSAVRSVVESGNTVGALCGWLLLGLCVAIPLAAWTRRRRSPD